MTKTRIGPTVELSAVIVRACSCGYSRVIGKPCEGCGNTRPPKVKDLGVIAANHQSRWKRVKWNLWGALAAKRRIRKANMELCD